MSVRDELTSHEYDGIQEFDNPTPGWWHVLFLGSVVFSLFYVVFWHFSPLAWSIHDTWLADKTREDKRIFGALGQMEPDAKTIMSLTGKPDLMNVGDGMFRTNCAQCHAADGGGINGVNLTDDHYKNVKKVDDIFAVLTTGAGNGAMPAWKNSFSKNELILLSAYVANLRGTTPARPRAAEGEVIPPWTK
jgi:cytochrome c oxidase cbb3-type subunit 3